MQEKDSTVTHGARPDPPGVVAKPGLSVGSGCSYRTYPPSTPIYTPIGTFLCSRARAWAFVVSLTEGSVVLGLGHEADIDSAAHMKKP